MIAMSHNASTAAKTTHLGGRTDSSTVIMTDKESHYSMNKSTAIASLEDA